MKLARVQGGSLGHSRKFQDFEAVWAIHPGSQYRMVYLGYVESFDSAANTYDITIPQDNTVFRGVPAEFVWKIHPSKLPGYGRA